MMIEAFVIRCNTHFLSHPWNYHGTESLCLLAELGLVTTGQRVCCLQHLLSFTCADIVCYSYKDTWIHDVRRLFAYMHTWTAILAFHTFIHEYTTSVGCFVYMHNEHKRLSFWLFHECTHDTRREQPVLYTCTMNTRDSHPGFSYIHTWIHDVSRLFCIHAQWTQETLILAFSCMHTWIHDVSSLFFTRIVFWTHNSMQSLCR